MRSRPIRHGDGYRIRWTDPVHGRRSATYPTLQAANEALAMLQLGLQTLPVIEAPKEPGKTFGEVAEAWLAARPKAGNTAINDRSRLKTWLLPAFSALPVDQITPQVVAKFCDAWPKKQSSLVTVFNTLAAILRWAVHENYLDKMPNLNRPRKPPQSFSYLRNEKDLSRFLVHAQKKDEIAGLVYRVAVYTGLREGELAGIKWADVDLRKRLITVQRSFTSPYTKPNQIRYVPILDSVLGILTSAREVAKEDWVLFDRGAPLNRHNRFFKSFFRRMVKELDFGYPLRFHDLRHTFASHWVMNGGDIFRLQKILGHSDVKMTLRYAHLAPDAYASDWGRF